MQKLKRWIRRASDGRGSPSSGIVKEQHSQLQTQALEGNESEIPRPPWLVRAFHQNDWDELQQMGYLKLKPNHHGEQIAIVVLGSPGIGKKSLIYYLTYDDMHGGAKLAEDMLLCDSSSPRYFIDGSVYDLEVSRGPNQALEYWAMFQLYRHFGIILAYDIVSRDSFEEVSRLYEIIRHSCGAEMIPFPVMVLGLKLDKVLHQTKEIQSRVTRQEGEAFAKERGCLFAECSAKTGEGVQEDAFGVFVEHVHDTEMKFTGDAAELKTTTARARTAFRQAMNAVQPDKNCTGMEPRTATGS